jgi:putative transposase
LRQVFLHRDRRKVTKTATFSFKGNRYRVADYLRGQKVELRFDPFDLSRIEVWFRHAGAHGTAQNAFLQLAEPDRVVTTIHPDVEPDPSPVVPPDTGLDYLALLRAERDRLLQEQLQGIHFSQLTQSEENNDPPQ